MTMSTTLHRSTWLELDQFLEAYEAAQARDGRAELAKFLPAATHPLYREVLRELACLELEYSWNRGRPRGIHDLPGEFPVLLEDADCLQHLTHEEYRLRLQAGDHPDPGEYQRRYRVDTASWPAPASNGKTPAAAAPDAGSEMELAAQAYQQFLREAGAGSDFPADSVSTSLFRQLHQSDPERASRLASAVTNFPEPGNDFAGFQLLGELGKGSLAKVFLAQQGELAD